MGNYSWLIVTTNGACMCAVDWDACDFSKVPDGSEGYHIYTMKDLEDRPKTLQAVAELLDDRKLFGYLDNGYIEALREISRHMSFAGTPLEGQIMHPRIYFEEEGWCRLHYLEFHPGTDLVMWGTHSYNDTDLPTYPENATDEQYAAFVVAKKEAHLKMIERGRWGACPLLPLVRDPPAALVLMSLLGIRPEDPDALEKAMEAFDYKKAMETPASELFGYHPSV